MKFFNSKTVVKEWKEYGAGIAYRITVEELLKLLKSGEVQNAKTNRKPEDSPWAKGALYTYSRNLIFGAMNSKKMHEDYVGQADSINVFVDEDGHIWIIDGGHRAEELGHLNDDLYEFKAKGKGETKDCEFLDAWAGKTVQYVKTTYPSEWKMLMDSVMMISTVSDDGIIQQGNNAGRAMSGVEKAYAVIKNNPTYIALEKELTLNGPKSSKFANINIGANKGNNVRVRVNNMCWLVSILCHHRLEKSGEAMRYMVENYSAEFIIASYNKLMSIITPSKFPEIMTPNNKGTTVYNCNAIHGVIHYARMEVADKATKDLKKAVVAMGDNKTTGKCELTARRIAAEATLKYLEEHETMLSRKVKAVKKKYGEDFVPASGAGHVGGGTTLYRRMKVVR